MRWLVGDVQGCARELDHLLRDIRFDPVRDELWCLGDLVNRGPDSLEALRLWRDVGGRGILGNHDVYALQVASGTRRRRRDTLDRLLEAEDSGDLLGRLRALPVLVHLAGANGVRDVWIVHAGLHPGWNDLNRMARRFEKIPHDDEGLRDRRIDFAIRVRCCDPKGKIARGAGRPESCVAPFRPWDDYYRGSALIVHGHWATRGYYRGERTMGLDSGCVYGGGLTAWCQEEDRIVRVPST